jgi:hypothetical protein
MGAKAQSGPYDGVIVLVYGGQTHTALKVVVSVIEFKFINSVAYLTTLSLITYPFLETVST